MRFVCLSDTHTKGDQVAVPEGDVLLHAGDHTFRGTERETLAALDWLVSLPHKTKIFIAGNHDFFFDPKAPKSFRNWKVRGDNTPEEWSAIKQATLAKYPSLIYLEDSSMVVEGIKVYGSPWQPWFHGWAFNFQHFSVEQAQQNWTRIPEDTDILLTHTPPNGILDTNRFDPGWENHREGCPVLRKRLHELDDVRCAPKVHVFGHIHGGAGELDIDTLPTHFINAAICTEDYEPTNPPITFDL